MNLLVPIVVPLILGIVCPAVSHRATELLDFKIVLTLSTPTLMLEQHCPQGKQPAPVE
jgi:hypothetical protein